MTARPAIPVTDAEDFAQLAADFLDDATASPDDHAKAAAKALVGVGYALLALREQMAEQKPRRRWRRRATDVGGDRDA
jgi:hypothetical protein